MFEQSIGRLAPTVAAMLLTRGSSAPPLVWHSSPHRTAKRTLDESDDVKLFARESLVNEAMAASVRALLYLWNGWIGECAMHGQLAEPKERLYLAGLCERQLGHSEEAKRAFRQIDGHALYTPLAADAIDIIGNKPQAALKRFRDIVEMGAVWEPFAFVDLYQQAATGTLDAEGDEIVRRLQCREYERLLAYCYEAATGDAITVETARVVAPPRKAPVPKRRSPSRPPAGSSKSDKRSEDPRSSRSDKPAAASGGANASARVVCPKCRNVVVAPASLFGKAVRCPNCAAFFEVPRAAASTGSR